MCFFLGLCVTRDIARIEALFISQQLQKPSGGVRTARTVFRAPNLFLPSSFAALSVFCYILQRASSPASSSLRAFVQPPEASHVPLFSLTCISITAHAWRSRHHAFSMLLFHYRAFSFPLPRLVFRGAKTFTLEHLPPQHSQSQEIVPRNTPNRKKLWA